MRALAGLQGLGLARAQGRTVTGRRALVGEGRWLAGVGSAHGLTGWEMRWQPCSNDPTYTATATTTHTHQAGCTSIADSHKFAVYTHTHTHTHTCFFSSHSLILRCVLASVCHLSASASDAVSLARHWVSSRVSVSVCMQYNP